MLLPNAFRIVCDLVGYCGRGGCSASSQKPSTPLVRFGNDGNDVKSSHGIRHVVSRPNQILQFSSSTATTMTSERANE